MKKLLLGITLTLVAVAANGCSSSPQGELPGQTGTIASGALRL